MDAPLEVGLLLYPGAQRAAIEGLTDLLTIASDIGRRTCDRKEPMLRVAHIACREEDGVAVQVQGAGLHGTRRFATVIVPPGLSEPPDRRRLGRLIDFMRDQHAGGATLASVCAGTFVLAETGLLEGRPATTHWAYGHLLSERFPAIRVDVGRLIIDDGDLVTAGGLMAWTDLGLTIVERLLGSAIMLETARYLVVDPPRRHQRSYNVFSPELTHGDEAILKVQHWLRVTALHDVTASVMARQAGMEERTFFRRFRKATGLTPLEYCQQLRITKARELLEMTRRPISQISWDSGYHDSGTFRKIFTRIAGLSPKDYRRRFLTEAAARNNTPPGELAAGAGIGAPDSNRRPAHAQKEYFKEIR